MNQAIVPIALVTAASLLGCRGEWLSGPQDLENGESRTQSLAAEAVFASLVEKGTVTSFRNRLASQRYHLVVTDRPVAQNLKQVELEPREGARYVLVELDNRSERPLPGEEARLDKFAVVSLPAGKNAHDFLGSHRYFVEEIGSTVFTKSDRSLDAGVLRTPDSLTKKRSLESALEIKDIEIDAAYLKGKVRQLSGADPVVIGDKRFVISERRSEEGRRNARRFLRHEYEDLGYTVSEHKFEVRSSQKGVNLIAERSGRDSSAYVIVSAHYDTVGNAGADDNGSGVISALATAKAIAAMDLSVGVRFLAFDQEEKGLAGSEEYVKHLKKRGDLDGLVGVINVEMTGYDSDGDGAFHVMDCNENISDQLSNRLMQVVTDSGLDLEREDACTNRSDHAAFWKADKAAIVVSQNFFGGDHNPCYHQSCDTVTSMNFDYMDKLTTAIARTVAILVVD